MGTRPFWKDVIEIYQSISQWIKLYLTRVTHNSKWTKKVVALHWTLLEEWVILNEFNKCKAFLADSTLATDLSFKYCPHRSCSPKKLDCLAVYGSCKVLFIIAVITSFQMLLFFSRFLFSVILFYYMNNINLILHCFVSFVVRSLCSPVWGNCRWFN